MFNLALRSVLTLVVLFGILFAVLTAALYTTDAPVWLALVIVLAFGGVQYAISPFIIEWIFKIRWQPAEHADPGIATLIRQVCHERGLREPKFGVIEDGNPNAFTFGHYPGDARLVITRGILDLCDEQERRAVVAHELGHIVHWDFVVMTVAATIPLVLYYIFRFGIRGRRGKEGGVVVLVALAAFVAYIVSQYIVMFLSRVREYYADQYSGQITRNPNALATALVKIAYGLARNPIEREDEKTGKLRPAAAVAGGAKMLGIFDRDFGGSLALATASTSAAIESTDQQTVSRAMAWDLFNPWATICELNSTHPLPARRLRALQRQAEKIGQRSTYQLPEKAAESYWDEFFVDLLMNYLPLLGLLGGIAAAIVLGAGGQIVAGAGAALLGLGLGLLGRTIFAYPKVGFTPRGVADLVSEVKASRIRSVPASLEGRIIGRGIPGLYWSEDLVLQDASGFITLDYRQPIRTLELLFGLFRAERFVGQRVRVEGWYRRYPRPYLELWKLHAPDGTTQTSHNWAVTFWGSMVLTFIGLLIAAGGLLMAAA